MTLRSRLIGAFLLLLIITLGGSYFAMYVMLQQSAFAEYRSRATSLTEIFSLVGQYTVEVAESTDAIIGKQMVAQAMLASHMVDVAENRAEMSSEEIAQRLMDITERSVVDEFWITDEKGYAYLRTQEDVEFTFGRTGLRESQSEPFMELLETQSGQVEQRAMPREYDGRVFKYAGVSGLDRPRIVQVGYEAKTLQDLSRGIDPTRLTESVIGKASILGVQVLVPDGDNFPKVLADHADSDILGESWASLCADLPVVLETGETRFDQTGNVLSFLVPGEGRHGPFAILISYDASGAKRFVRRGALIMVLVTAAVLVIGTILSVRLARSISNPLERVATEAVEIGKGDFGRQVTVGGVRETRLLANAFNSMTRSLGQYVVDLRRATVARERIESELRIASEVQRSMMPKELPRISGVELAAYSQPARVVGGDFYDLQLLGNGLLELTIGDVAGKGMPAALLASQSLSLLRLAGEDALNLETLVERGNRLFERAVESGGNFVTMFGAIYDPTQCLLTFVNAGHPPPILLRSKCEPSPVSRVSTYPLGVVESLNATEQRVRMKDGDSLILFTDGITEAQDSNYALYGEERLLDCLSHCDGCGPEEIVHAIRNSVLSFTGGHEQSDDLSLVVIRVNQQAA